VFQARLYDGLTAHAFEVSAEIAEHGVRLSGDQGWSESIELSLLRRLDSDKLHLRLGRSDIEGWRLTLPAEATDAVTALLGKPERYGRWVDRIGLGPALGAFAAVAVAVIAIGHFAPAWIAPHVPSRWERNLGDAILGDFGDNRCRDGAGQAALEAMAERVAPGSTKGPDGIQIAALNINIFNAAALPGGHIVVFKGAIAETEDPEALAGIMAHEIAHVRRRHVTQALIRELGIGALIRLFAGTVGTNAEQLIALSYTRDNEAQADADAIEMLKAAGISPKPTAALFRKLAKQTGEGRLHYSAQFLQSHPLSIERAKKFDASVNVHAKYRSALSMDEAGALSNLCRSQDD
jgi:beta-barrel assembly-enhancing protease